jgi:hypothetical protein
VTPRVSVLCPTRNRPDSVLRLADSALATAEGPVEMVFWCDDDAPGSVPDDTPGDVTVLTGPRRTMSDMWNPCWRAARSDVYMLCADDVAFRTPGWDTMVLRALTAWPDRIAWVFGGDGTGIHPEDYGTHGFVHRAWTDAVGYFTPPYFSCDYADTWLNDLAARVGRRHRVRGLLTEHLHPAVGRGAWDASHAERVERGRRDDVAAIWRSTGDERERDAEKLRKAMRGGPWCGK